MTQPVIVVPVVVVIVVVRIPRTRNTPLVFLGFLQRFSRSILGRRQLPGLELAPQRAFIHPLLQTKQRQCTVVLQASLLKQMKGGLLHLGVGTRSQMILTLGQESVGSGVLTLVLGQVSVKLTFWEDLGYLLILLLRNYSLGQVQECVNLTPMHGDWSSLCKFCGGKCLKGIILSLQMSSSSTTNPHKLTNPLAFINSLPGVKIVD